MRIVANVDLVVAVAMMRMPVVAGVIVIGSLGRFVGNGCC
jgi:hypothetical protein